MPSTLPAQRSNLSAVVIDLATRLLGLATFVDTLLGLDREVRGHAACLRTHGVISLSSAVITLSALTLFGQLCGENAQPDPLRVIQGLAKAIGFIPAGLFCKRWRRQESNLSNLQTSQSDRTMLQSFLAFPSVRNPL